MSICKQTVSLTKASRLSNSDQLMHGMKDCPCHHGRLGAWPQWVGF